MDDVQQPVRRVRRTPIKRVAMEPEEAPVMSMAEPAPEPVAMPMQEAHVARGNTSRKAVIVGVVAVALIIGAVFGVKTLMPSAFASKASRAQASGGDTVPALVASVAKHILIKQDETPAVATVMDPDSLRQQNAVFYKDAQKGDRLLIWSDKAVLYSPARDLLISVMPIPASVVAQAQQQQQQQQQAAVDQNAPAPAADVTETANIEIRNGSGVAGQGKKLAAALKAAGLTTLPPGDAKTKQAKTLIINLSGKQLPKTLQALQQVTGGQTANLPAEEGKPKGDILIIIGSDYSPQ